MKNSKPTYLRQSVEALVRRSKVLLGVSFLSLTLLTNPALAVNRQTAFVEKVLSGDTVLLRGGKTLAYASCEAPSAESADPLIRSYAQSAKELNRTLVEGKSVEIEWGSQLRDSRGRLMGYVFVEKDLCANLEMVKAGYALARLVAPNLKYAADFRRAELDAHRDKRGLWEKVPDNPLLRHEYIGEMNTKIYYFPTSPELDRIPQAHQVRFNSRVEAKAAGYRPCPACHEDEVVLT